MNRKRQIVSMLILMVLLAVSAVPGGAAPMAQTEPVGLARVRWQAAADLAPVEALDIPVYARLWDATGPYLLVGATAGDVATLRAEGLSATLLDANVAGAAYYLASPAPNRRALALMSRWRRVTRSRSAAWSGKFPMSEKNSAVSVCSADRSESVLTP